MPPARTINRERARRLRRERGLTYAQIAEEMGCSWNSVYYACNPEKRREQTGSEQKRSVYIPAALWEELAVAAELARVSRSRLIVDVLTGERPALPALR